MCLVDAATSWFAVGVHSRTSLGCGALPVRAQVARFTGVLDHSRRPLEARRPWCADCGYDGCGVPALLEITMFCWPSDMWSWWSVCACVCPCSWCSRRHHGTCIANASLPCPALTSLMPRSRCCHRSNQRLLVPRSRLRGQGRCRTNTRCDREHPAPTRLRPHSHTPVRHVRRPLNVIQGGHAAIKPRRETGGAVGAGSPSGVSAVAPDPGAGPAPGHGFVFLEPTDPEYDSDSSSSEDGLDDDLDI